MFHIFDKYAVIFIMCVIIEREPIVSHSGVTNLGCGEKVLLLFTLTQNTLAISELFDKAESLS